jgi:hypothetical protein
MAGVRKREQPGTAPGPPCGHPSGDGREGARGVRPAAGNGGLEWSVAAMTDALRTPPPATTLRYFALDGTDHAGHKEQARMIRWYIIWRNNHAYDERLRRIIDRASAA